MELIMQDKVISYAQNREDIILAAFFPKKHKGFYIDVGAHDPDDDTVTKYFYEKGWRGINIEPNKRLFGKLEIRRGRDINLNLGVADKDGELKFREYVDGDGLSTFSPDVRQEYAKKPSQYTAKYADHLVKVTTLEKIIAKHAPTQTIDFLKVDVEGFEYEVLESNNWTKYRPRVLCIESNHIKHDWRPHLQSNEYALVFNDGFNDYYVDTTKDIKFDYVGRAISKYTLYFRDYEKIEALARTNAELVRKAKLGRESHIRQVENLQAQIDGFAAELHRIRRFKAATVNMLTAFDKAMLARIDNLSKAKPSQTAKAYKPLEKEIEGLDKVELLRLARKNDMENYFSYAPPHTPKKLLHTATLFGYKAVKKGIKKSGKTALRLKRAVKGRK